MTYTYQITAVDNTTPANENVPTVPVESTPSAANVPGAPSNGVVVSSAQKTTIRLEAGSFLATRKVLLVK